MTQTEFEQKLDAWLNERLTNERERFLKDQSFRSYFRLWLYLSLEAKKRQVAAVYSTKEGPSLRERITQLGYALRGLVQKPGRVASRLRYAHMSSAEKIAHENAYLDKLLTILRHHTPYTVGKGHFGPDSKTIAKRPANHINGAMGPLQDRDMDNDFVRVILEGSGFAPAPIKETETITITETLTLAEYEERVRENLVRTQREREKGTHARRSGD
jgi:hypothetical protein